MRGNSLFSKGSVLTSAPAPQRLSRKIVPSLLAIALIVAAAGVNYLLQTAIGPAYSGYAAPFLLAIVIAARTGYIPGIVACTLSFPVGYYVFGGEFGWRGVDPARVIMAYFVSVLVSRMTATKQITTRQNEIIAEQNRKLSMAVDDLQRKTDDVSTAHAALNAVLNAATQTGIVGVDPEGIITLFNTGAESLLGRRAAEVVGTTPFTSFLVGEAIGPGAAAARHVEFADLVRPEDGKQHSDRDLILVRPDGARLIANISLTTQRDGRGAGPVSGYVAVIRDITELRRNEAAIVEAMRVAEAAAQTQSVFLATMSHEIRTPMNGVIGMTGLLLDTPLAAGAARIRRDHPEFQRDAAHHHQRHPRLLQDRSGQAGRSRTFDFDLHDVVEECARDCSPPSAHGKGIELALPVAPAERRAWCAATAAGSARCSLNLLGNAVKFTERGEVVADRRAASPAARPGVLPQFAVTDTGIGISARGPGDASSGRSPRPTRSTTRRYGGTGLGLAISKRLVELMGGEIGVTSEAGRGARRSGSRRAFGAGANPLELARRPTSPAGACWSSTTTPPTGVSSSFSWSGTAATSSSRRTRPKRSPPEPIPGRFRRGADRLLHARDGRPRAGPPPSASAPATVGLPILLLGCSDRQSRVPLPPPASTEFSSSRSASRN